MVSPGVEVDRGLAKLKFLKKRGFFGKSSQHTPVLVAY